MTVATRSDPNYTTMSAAVYKAAIDAAFAVDKRLAAAFAPHQQDVGSPTPDMSVRIDAGYIWDGTSLTEVAAQTVSGFTVPASNFVRVDRVVLNPATGACSRVAGVAQTVGSPTAVAPAITTGCLPVCQIAFTASSTVISNSMITDERIIPLGLAGLTLTGKLLFSADNTNDIGASGATRPRDLYLGRNLIAGGTGQVATTLGVGAATPAASGAGVSFPATQSASSDANTLDDYEEGTWTPVLGGSGGTSGQTYSIQQGRYVKVGQLALADWGITFSAKGTITTSLQVQGLPFTVLTAAGANVFGSTCRFANLQTNWIHVYAECNVGATTATVKGIAAAGTTNDTALATGDVNNSTTMTGCLRYRASA